MFYYFQVLVIGDSIVRGIKWQRFDIKTFPGITTEKLLNKVVLSTNTMNHFRNYMHIVLLN